MSMSTRLFALLSSIVLFTACAPKSVIQPTISTPGISTPTVVSETPSTQITPTGLAKPDLSYKVAAFYYPWYGNLARDNQWLHWTQNNHVPPNDIASDYFPALGAYSSNDPKVLAQHMQWLREAGIGIIIISWWGQGSTEDQALPQILQIADEYGIKVAFHIEPYNGRTPKSLVSDVQYIYEKYGDSRAFFRSTMTTRYSPSDHGKGMFFVWNLQQQGNDFSSWQTALDQIHALPESALVIANSLEARWIEGSHFDGLYNYASLHLDETNGFNWARSLPPDSLYVPSVLPGFSARRVGYAENTYVPRENGTTFDTQWTAALGTGVEPALVTITSFNEWHEGTMIEPSQSGASDGAGYTYADFGDSGSGFYLFQTRDWVDRYLTRAWPNTYRMRIKVSTTSDWTTLDILENGTRVKPTWIRPERISASESATTAAFEGGDRLTLTQALAEANAGKEVEMTWDVLLTQLETGDDLSLQIDRGNIGKTQVTIYNYMGSTPVKVKSFTWDQVTSGRNSYQISVPAELLMNTSP